MMKITFQQIVKNWANLDENHSPHLEDTAKHIDAFDPKLGDIYRRQAELYREINAYCKSKLEK